MLLYVLTEILKLLHPFMPFITEEIWQSLPHEGEALMIERYPVYSSDLDFTDEERKFEAVMEAVKAVRARRAEMNVPPSKKTHLYIVSQEPVVFSDSSLLIKKLAYAESISVSTVVPAESEKMINVTTDNARIFIPLQELVDVEKEIGRIEKELEKSEKLLASQIAKLSNENFVSRAPENVVNAEREKKSKLEALIVNLKQSLSDLKSL